MHAYLEGLGVELMANSDNVLRAGLTPKHIDVNELLSLLSCDAVKAEILRPRAVRRGSFIEEEYPRRAAEFALSVLKPAEGAGQGETALETSGPEILLCGAGRARVETASAVCELKRGESLFIPASEKICALKGGCVVYRARVPSARDTEQ
jgi:mannose-6-phosphate isomerase